LRGKLNHRTSPAASFCLDAVPLFTWLLQLSRQRN
jgi:hypothetical protein